MHFEYEIRADEYAASQAAYFRLIRGRKRILNGGVCSAVGLFFIAIALSERVFDWAPILLGTAGAWLVYCGIMNFFPEIHFRRFYGQSGMSGRRFQVEMDEQKFQVTSDSCTWRVEWPGVEVKAEEKCVFMIYAAGTIFMFGKQYLTPGQQRDLRKFAGFRG